jgi:mannose-6-phosphate isomerase-like protein (cupin superfamily)
MSDPEIVISPLLHRAMGGTDSEFVVHENMEVASGFPRGSVPLHRHRTEDEAWYILEGTLRFQYGSREVDASAGAGVLLPHGIPHTFWNPGPGTARYLLIVGPKTEGLLQRLHGSHALDDTSPRAVYDSFDVDLLE